MSSNESIALVREIYAAWGRGEWAGRFMDHDIEYVNPPDALEPGTRRGRSLFSTMPDLFDDLRAEARRVVPVGDEVLVVAVIRGRGKGSGAPVQREQGHVWTVRDGRAVRFRWFRSAEDALRDLGLDA